MAPCGNVGALLMCCVMLCTADWTILNPSTGLTIDVGIAFPKDGDVAYIAGDSNAGHALHILSNTYSRIAYIIQLLT
jgi:hypothetical protein